ncbi:MAG: oxidoreductase [Actinomycetota bacterium]
MAFTEASIPDLTGRVAVVTGANGGLGLATAKALAGAGAHVVMVARNQTKAADARDEILADDPDASLEVVELDLGSQASTIAAAEQIAAAHQAVDILVNNAGVMAMPEGRTVDGFETQFGINHLGHWTFTAKLLPSLLAADAARVVAVTSVARHQGKPVDPADPHLEKGYDAWGAYGRSKLANFHFAIGLQRAFEEAGVAAQSFAAHPGLTNSDLQSHTVSQGGGGFNAKFFARLTPIVGMSTAAGARPQLRAATDPAAKGGEYYAPRWGTNGAAVERGYSDKGVDEAVAKLWAMSEELTGVTMDVRAAKSTLEA